MTSKAENVINDLTREKKKFEERYEEQKQELITMITAPDFNFYKMLQLLEYVPSLNVMKTARQLYETDAQLRALNYVCKDEE